MPRGVEPGLPPPPPFGALVWAVTQKAPARSRAPGGGVRPGARSAAGRWGASRRAEPGAGVQAPTPRSPRPPRSPPRASSRAGGGRAGTTPRCYRRRRRLRLCRERPSPLQREVGDFRFVSLLCPSRVGGCERGAEGWIPSPPLLPRPEPGKRGRGAATWCVGGLLLGSGLGWRAARVPGRGVRCTAGRSRGAGEGGSLELRFSRALAELGWRLGRGSGAVGGSAESSDAPWSSSLRERVSCPRRARPGGCTCARAPQLRPHPARTLDSALASPLWSKVSTPRSCPRAPLRGPGTPVGRRGSCGGPDVGGLLCGPTCLGRLLLEGQRQDKAGWTRGTLHARRRSPIPPRVGVGRGEAPHGLGKSREIGKTVTGT